MRENYIVSNEQFSPISVMTLFEIPYCMVIYLVHEEIENNKTKRSGKNKTLNFQCIPTH
jgi:hypothetical protein